MKLYLLTNCNQLRWDEFNGAVIAAKDHQKAKEIMFEVLNTHRQSTLNWKCKLIAKETVLKMKEGFILSSFRHG